MPNASLKAGPEGSTVEVSDDSDGKKAVLYTNRCGGNLAIYNDGGDNVLQTSVNHADAGCIAIWNLFDDLPETFPKEDHKFIKRIMPKSGD